MTIIVTNKIGRIVEYPCCILKVPVYIPLQTPADTRHVAVMVIEAGMGPQDASPLGLVARLIFAGLFTIVWKRTVSNLGAHFTTSLALPELSVPRNLIVTGLVDHMTFDELFDATPTDKYAPTITSDMVSPRNKCRGYCLRALANGKVNRRLSEFKTCSFKDTTVCPSDCGAFQSDFSKLLSSL